jgi:hypothetical protein
VDGKCDAKRRGDDNASGASFATASGGCGDECAVIFNWFIVKKDADDSCVGCVEEKLMKSCFW